MGLSGFVGSGVQDALSQQLMEQLRVAALAEEQRQALEREAMASREQARREAEDRAMADYRTRALDEQGRARRDRANQAGVEDLFRQGQMLQEQEAAQAQQSALADVLGTMPEGPGKRLINLQRLGAGKNLSASDLMTPDEAKAAREADTAGDVARAGAIAREQARYREPRPTERHPHVVNGKLVYLTPDEVNQMGGVSPSPRQRPVTGQERTNLGFYQRAEQANKIAAPLEENIAKMTLAGQTRLQYAPNFAQSPENQSYRQAQRAFTEARLRKESGAAIPQQEYENDARTYFAQPGDSPQVIRQKQKARQQVLESLGVSTGGAWEEYYGEPRQKGADHGTDVDRAKGVVRWEKGPDGKPRRVGG